MHKIHEKLIITGAAIITFLAVCCLTVNASGKLSSMINSKRSDIIHSLNVAGTYYGHEANKQMKLRGDGSFLIRGRSSQTDGKFKMEDFANITFEWGGGKITKGEFKGNVLVDHDGDHWFKELENRDVAGKYYASSNKHIYLELKEDGSLQGMSRPPLKVSGKYEVSPFDIVITLQDPTGKYPDEEDRLKFGSDIPGRGHDILVGRGIGIDFIKRFEKTETIVKYIQEDTYENNYLELKADGAFFIRIEPQVLNGIYEINGDVIKLQMGKGELYIPAYTKSNNTYLTIDSIEGLEGKKWLKQ